MNGLERDVDWSGHSLGDDTFDWVRVRCGVVGLVDNDCLRALAAASLVVAHRQRHRVAILVDHDHEHSRRARVVFASRADAVSDVEDGRHRGAWTTFGVGLLVAKKLELRLGVLEGS